MRQTEIGAIRQAAAKIKGPTLNKRRTSRASHAPTAFDILAIPAAVAGVYQLNEAETKRTRSRIYSLNRENAAGWRWRTLLEGDFLLVWRVH